MPRIVGKTLFATFLPVLSVVNASVPPPGLLATAC